MKLLADIPIGTQKLSFFEDDDRAIQMWFSTNSKEDDFSFNCQVIQGFLDVAQLAPGREPCNFTVEHQQENGIEHIIFKGNLGNAIEVLDNILNLDPLNAIVKKLKKMSKDIDEDESIRSAISEKTKTKEPISRTHKKNNHGHYKKSELTDTTPLLQRPTLIK